MNPTTALYNFLLAQLTPDELRRWLGAFPGGKNLLSELPGVSVNAAQFHWDATDLLQRHGILRQDDTWDRLLEVRPNFKAEIDALKTEFIPNGRPTRPLAPEPKDGPPTHRVNQAPPSMIGSKRGNKDDDGKPIDVLKILLVSACPDDQDRLRVDREFRDIIDKLRGARHRDRLRVEQVHAASLASLRTALLEHEPHVLHISCHATPSGDLLLEGPQGASQQVGKRSMLGLFQALADNLRLVFLNGCDTDQLARGIPPTIDTAIGMRKPITDTAAIELSVAFYEALAFGRSIATAFAIALPSLGGLGEDSTPELFPPADADPGNKRKQKLIEP